MWDSHPGDIQAPAKLKQDDFFLNAVRLGFGFTHTCQASRNALVWPILNPILQQHCQRKHLVFGVDSITAPAVPDDQRWRFLCCKNSSRKDNVSAILHPDDYPPTEMSFRRLSDQANKYSQHPGTGSILIFLSASFFLSLLLILS